MSLLNFNFIESTFTKIEIIKVIKIPIPNLKSGAVYVQNKISKIA
tara:strand:+ start:626 stop:760 length:135 start_codon:yes stop_codon:yes gene_type:complete